MPFLVSGLGYLSSPHCKAKHPMPRPTHTRLRLVALLDVAVFRAVWLTVSKSSLGSFTAAWRSGDQVCVVLLTVKISAKWRTYVKLIGILASFLISNHDLSICYLSSFNSSQITVCCSASRRVQHHASSIRRLQGLMKSHIQPILFILSWAGEDVNYQGPQLWPPWDARRRHRWGTAGQDTCVTAGLFNFLPYVT